MLSPILLVATAAATRSPVPLNRRAMLSATTAAMLSGRVAPLLAAEPATFAQRFSVSGNISPLPPLGQYSRYED